MKSAEQSLREYLTKRYENHKIDDEIGDELYIEDCIEVMKEYAEQQSIAFGKKLGLIGTSYRATPTSDQWEYITKAGELYYRSTEELYKEFIK